MTRPTDYPMQWPQGIERHTRRASSQFRTTLAGAMKNVQDSLRLFATDSGKPISETVISSNVTLGNQSPDDPGVAVWFLWDGEWRCIAADRYIIVQDNVQAIHHILESERTKMRHGGLHIVRATFRAFLALPATGPPWWTILGVSREATAAEIRAAHRARIAGAHPDKGGTHTQASEINAARDQGLAERKVTT